MEFNFDVFLTLPSFYTLTSRWEIMGTFRISNCKGNSQIPNSNIPTLQLMWHFVIPATLCNHPPKKLHQVTMPIDHSVCVTYCLSLPHCSPFYFHALLLPSYSISILFHILFPILSVFHILPLSLFRDPLLVAMHSVPYVVPLHLGSPQSFLFGSPLQVFEHCAWLWGCPYTNHQIASVQFIWVPEDIYGRNWQLPCTHLHNCPQVPMNCSHSYIHPTLLKTPTCYA